MKRVVAFLMSVMMVFMLIPSMAQAATEDVTLKVVADKTTVNQGDTVNFSVTIGAISSLGGLEFYVDIPDGMTIVDSSIVIPDGVSDTLDSDGDIVLPAPRNNYKWSYSAKSDGYAGTSDFVVLTFACTVDDNSAFEEKSVGITVDTCFDNIDLDEHNVIVVPAKVTVEKVKVAVGGVSLDKTTITLKDGETATLVATVSPEDADNKNLIWSSNNKEVATVVNGTVTAVKTGTAKITVTTEDGNKIAECTVTVTCNHALNKTDAVAATCGKAGNIEYYTCSKCNKMFADDTASAEVTDVVVPATGNHAETEVKDAVAATEATEGYTGDTYCKTCGTKLETGSVIPKLPHTHAMVKTDAVEATCEADGNIEYYTCSKCGKVYTDEAGTKELTSVVVKATGHKAVDKWEADEDAHWKLCENCNEQMEKENHSFSWVVDQAATEDATGTKHEECICGWKRNEGTEIPKLDHVHTGIEHYEAAEATCVDEGSKEYWTCSSEKCDGKYYADAECQVEITDIVVAKNPENHVDDGSWEVDADKHIRICVCGVIVDEAEHSYDDDNDANCNVCDYKRFYIVTSGANATYEQNAKNGLTFEIDGDLALFQILKIDDVVVETENYTLAEGSTILTIKSDYLNKLTIGKHSMEVAFSDGKVATTSFNVKEEKKNNTSQTPPASNTSSNTESVVNTPNASVTDGTVKNEAQSNETIASPKTEDEYQGRYWVVLIMIVLVGAMGVTTRTMYKNKNR